MKHICLQENDYDCGLACIKMMLSHYHNNKNLLDLDKEKINGRYSLSQLQSYAKRYNLLTEGVEFENKGELYKYENSIVVMQYNGKSHFMIFEKKRKNFVYLIDPKIGRLKLLENEFLDIFSGYALIKKEIEKLEHIEKKIKNPNLNYILIYITFLIFDFGLLTLLSYLENDSKYIFHSLLVIFTIILLMISKISLINRHLFSIDEEIKKILSTKITLNQSTKKGLLLYKISTIRSIYGLINSVFICLFVSLILLINNWLNFAIILFILLISTLYSKISLINNNSNNFKLSILEEKFYISDDRNIYDELIAKSNEIQKNKSTLIVINQFIIVCSVTILNNFSNINSFQFVLFSTIYYFILFNQFNNFLNHLTSDRLEYRKYASSYNYLKKQISKELIKSNNEKNDG